MRTRRRYSVLLVLIFVVLVGGLWFLQGARLYRRSLEQLRIASQQAQESRTLLSYQAEAEARVNQLKQELIEATNRAAAYQPPANENEDLKKLLSVKRFVIDTDTRFAENCKIKSDELVASSERHKTTAERYRRAILRPWLWISLER